MSLEVFKNAFWKINATDLSDDITSLTLNYSAESLDASHMGVDSRIHKGGLFDWSFDITFNQDFAASQVDATLFGLVGTTVCLEFRPKNICSTAINPTFSGIGTVETYPPASGAVGSLLQATVRITSAGDLSRSPCSS